MVGCHKIFKYKKSMIILLLQKKLSKQIINFSFNKVNLNWKNHTIIDKKNFRKFEIDENYSSTRKLKKNIKMDSEIQI